MNKIPKEVAEGLMEVFGSDPVFSGIVYDPYTFKPHASIYVGPTYKDSDLLFHFKVEAFMDAVAKHGKEKVAQVLTHLMESLVYNDS